MLAGAAPRDLSTSLLGLELPTPLLLAPVGVIGLCAQDGHGDLATARAAARTGVPMVASTLSEDPMEDVGAALGDTPGLFQLYTPADRDLAQSFVRRAEAAGFRGIVVTLDTQILGWRPRDLELASFPQLKGRCLANYFSDPVFRTKLENPPRARIAAAADEERRRVVRDLHDGAQQRLVHTILTLKSAHQALQDDDDTAPALVTEALDHAERATAELRELAHGILPGVLTHGGLRAAVEALASRMPLPVENGVAVGRLPAAVEATAYFVVSEALTNVAKHARAGHAEVTARIKDGTLAVRVRDDGKGGARPDGSGLVGLADRLAALDGQLRVESPADGGTLIAAAVPIGSSAPALRS